MAQNVYCVFQQVVIMKIALNALLLIQNFLVLTALQTISSEITKKAV